MEEIKVKVRKKAGSNMYELIEGKVEVHMENGINKGVLILNVPTDAIRTIDTYRVHEMIVKLIPEKKCYKFINLISSELPEYYTEEGEMIISREIAMRMFDMEWQSSLNSIERDQLLRQAIEYFQTAKEVNLYSRQMGYQVPYNFELYNKIKNESGDFHIKHIPPRKTSKKKEKDKEEYLSMMKNTSSLREQLSIIESIESRNKKGRIFEFYVADLIEKYGHKNVSVSAAIGDGGRDIDSIYKEIEYAIETKCFYHNGSKEEKVGQGILRSVCAYAWSKEHIIIKRPCVITTSYFTTKAKEYGNTNNVCMIDRDKLMKLIERVE